MTADLVDEKYVIYKADESSWMMGFVSAFYGD